MIDLHSHTTESDGTFSPGQLIAEAARTGLDALAITDHDTFAGYDQAVRFAAEASLELICGIELSTKFRGRSVHLLGYFLNAPPTAEFRSWVASLEASRQDRNRGLIQELRARGIPITLEEVSARAGKIIARPHFAGLLVEKGYASSIEQAFDEYLGESAPCYISRDGPEFGEATAQILAGGGLPVLPHPGRVRTEAKLLEGEVEEMQRLGLRGIEVYHSDHSPSDVARYASIARELGLAVTGGSDFHGAAKPGIALGTGIHGNLNIPNSVLDNLIGRRALSHIDT
jgi:predicted metal-dependent phosphoesterase TrpH